MDEYGLADLNRDVLYHVFSFLSPESIRRDVSYVNKYWKETAGTRYNIKLEMTNSVVYVDDRKKEDGKRVFSNLQRAVDTCCDYSTIVIRVAVGIC